MDYPYILLLFILLALAFLEWKRPIASNKYFSIASAVVFVFIAFRAPVVGVIHGTTIGMQWGFVISIITIHVI